MEIPVPPRDSSHFQLKPNTHVPTPSYSSTISAPSVSTTWNLRRPWLMRKVRRPGLHTTHRGAETTHDVGSDPTGFRFCSDRRCGEIERHTIYATDPPKVICVMV